MMRIGKLLSDGAQLFFQAQQVYDGVREVYTEFKGAQPDRGVDWEAALGVRKQDGRDAMEAAWRAKVAEAHPDRGGTEQDASKLNAARDAARAYFDAKEGK